MWVGSNTDTPARGELDNPGGGAYVITVDTAGDSEFKIVLKL